MTSRARLRAEQSAPESRPMSSPGRVREIKADYEDKVVVRFDIGHRHELSLETVRVEKLFQCPDLEDDAFEIVHDELHIFQNHSGKFFTLRASVVEVQELEFGASRSPWNVFTRRGKRERESAGLARPVSFEMLE